MKKEAKMKKIMQTSKYVVIVFSVILPTSVNGQCDNSGPKILSAENSPQYFTSPNYPSNYPANADCSWRIQAASPNDKIIINIEDYDSESVSSDYMDLYDGYNSSATRIIRMAVTNRKTLNAFVSSGDVLFITFVSDYTIQYSGFKILYVSNNTDNQHACNSNLIVNSQEQILMSQNLPKPYNASECSWTFSSSIEILFHIKFLDMGGCLQSYLRFYDGTSTNDDQLSSKCSTALTYEFENITTTGFNGHIAFKVTDQPLDYYGFMLVYRTNEVSSDAVITWTTPLGGNGTASVFEDAVVGHLVETIAATSANIVVLTLVTSNSPFALANTGALTVATATLDFETDTSYTLIIQASDASTSATATLTVSVTDVNEAPTFNASSFSECVIDKSAAGTSVTTLTANDPDSDSLTYAIANGNTNSDFAISSSAASVTTLNDLDKETSANYSLVITATDSIYTATATLVVTVNDTCTGGNGASLPVIGLSTLLVTTLLTLKIVNMFII